MANFWCNRTSGGALQASQYTWVAHAAVPAGTDQNLVNITINVVAAETVRFAMYVGGASDSDPGGATLLHDIGDISGDQLYPFPPSINVTAGERLWIVGQSAGTDSHRLRTGPSSCGNINGGPPLRAWQVLSGTFPANMPTGASWASFTSDIGLACTLLTQDISTGTGPAFVDPSPATYKVGDTLTNYDMAQWFVDYTGTLTVTTDQLPAGITPTGNLLNGTFTTSAQLTTVATGEDSDSPGNTTDGNVEWDIQPYRIHFTDNDRLEDGDAAPITTNNVVVTVVEGLPGTDISGATPIQLGSHSVSAGALTIDLPDTETAASTYTVLFEDTDETNTPLGVYVRGSL